MDSIQALVEPDHAINQQTLSDLGKNALRSWLKALDNGLDFNKLDRVWNRLVECALTKSAPERYLTAACNCICVFLLNATASDHKPVQACAASASAFFDAFECARNAFHCGKSKPALQVLETLVQLNSQVTDNGAAKVRVLKAIQPLTRAILTGKPSGQVKFACFTLSYFLRKMDIKEALLHLVDHLVNEDRELCLQRFRQSNVQAAQSDELSASHIFFLALLRAAEHLETRSAALKLFSQISRTQNHQHESVEEPEAAAKAFEIFSGNDVAAFGDFADNVLPLLLEDAHAYQTFLSQYEPSHDFAETKITLYLATLKVGRLKKFLAENDLSVTTAKAFAEFLQTSATRTEPYQAFDLLMKTSSPGIRLHAYDVLTTSHSPATPMPSGALDCLLRNFIYLHNETDPYDRGEILGITKRLLGRIEACITSLKKLHSVNKLDERGVQTLTAQQAFIVDMTKFIRQELQAGISYPRHILALQTLSLLMKLSCLPTNCLQELEHPLLSLALDPYEDIRALSTAILAQIYRKIEQFTDVTLTHSFLDAVSELSGRTCRHDHADAAGRLWAIALARKRRGSSVQNSQEEQHPSFDAIVERLWKRLASMESMEADTGFPLHALLLALAYYLNSGAPGSESHAPCDTASLLSICRRIWSCVQIDLCVDSPETEIDEAEDGGWGGPKDRLAYSWRALRDSSLLLQATIRISDGCRHVLYTAGELCFEQLTELRHRGAFSTVAQTFLLCCEQCRTSQSKSVRELNSIWYAQALEEIDKQSRKVTRRSAGLPAMFNAVLTSADPSFFARAIDALKDRAEKSYGDINHNNDGLPQVHALNCIKDIITNSKFKSITEEYVGGMIDLAARAMQSPRWPIRNCGLMLLRACINRFDTQGLATHAVSVAITGAKATRKKPLALAMELLEQTVQNQVPRNMAAQSEKIFAALDLVRHIGPAPDEDSQLRGLIKQQLSNSVWAIRDHAARVLAARISNPRDHVDTVPSELEVPHSSSENGFHGLLLLYRYVSANGRAMMAPDKHEQISGIIVHLESFIPRLYHGCSPHSLAAFLDILNDALLSLFWSGAHLGQRARQRLLEVLAQLPGPQLSLHRERVVLCNLLLLVLAPEAGQVQTATIQRTARNLASVPDEAIFVMNALRRGNGVGKPQIAILLADIAFHATANDAKATAMLGLADCLDEMEISYPSTRLQDLVAATIIEEDVDRELQNASIRLQASMLRHLPYTGATDHLRRLESWLHALSIASKDELEFRTRLNAAHALHSCAVTIVTYQDAETGTRARSAELQMLSILYDQLNDDDDEVRGVACSTCTNVQQRRFAEDGRSALLNALASREALIDLMLRHFGNTHCLPELALVRLVGEPGNRISPYKKCDREWHFEPVKSRLDRIIEAMDDLFAEERQNLYIDDIDEIDKWYNLLLKCDTDQVSLNLWMALTVWANDGLEAIISTMEERRDVGRQAGILGLMHHFEILLLCYRVVKTSDALQRIYRDNKTRTPSYSTVNTDLSTNLERLRSLCERVDAHKLLLRTLKDIDEQL